MVDWIDPWPIVFHSWDRGSFINISPRVRRWGAENLKQACSMSEKHTFVFVSLLALGGHLLPQHNSAYPDWYISIQRSPPWEQRKFHYIWFDEVGSMQWSKKLFYVSRSELSVLRYGFKWTIGACNPITLVITEQQCSSVSNGLLE